MATLSFVEAASEAAAIEPAVALLGLDDHKRRRLAVNPAAMGVPGRGWGRASG